MKRTLGLCIVVLALQTPAQLVDQIKALLDQLAAQVPAPVVLPGIKDADALDAALASASEGAVLRLDPALRYTKPLTLSRSNLTLQSTTWEEKRIDLVVPAPTFMGGITVTGSHLTLAGLEVRHPDPQHTILEVLGDHVMLDRVRVLGDPVNGCKHGIVGNGADVTLRRSYVEDCFRTYPGDDSQAFIAWSTPGPLTLEDNYLSGGSETVMIGGADAADAVHDPAHITIRGNTITKRPEWQQKAVGVKNILELKNARYVEIVNNDLSYSWGGKGQDGYALMLTVRNQGGKDPTATVQDVFVKGNSFAHTAGAINILGRDNNQISVTMARVQIIENSFTDLDPVKYTGSKRMILIDGGPQDVTLRGNLFAGFGMTSVIYFAGLPKLEQFNVDGNLWPKTTYGIFGNNATVGKAWDQYVASGTLGVNTVQ